MSRLLERHASIVEYLGCGCGRGPSARSLPAAAATWLLFGPFVAVARYAAAMLVDRALHHRAPGATTATIAAPPHLLGELASVFPAALAAGAAAHVAATFDPMRFSPLVNAFVGAILGLGAAPCGLGAVALAGVLRVEDPVAASSFLCVAGIVDFRALKGSATVATGHDALAYALLSVALSIVAWRHGDGLVHPAFAIALGCCACAAAFCAVAFRKHRCAAARMSPVLMLVGSLLGAAPPEYRVTQTTLADLFAGERLSFTGALTRNHSVAALVRYAITCCRADAAPIAVRLGRAPAYPAGTWLRVDGTIESVGNEFELTPGHIERIPTPTDPFVYL